MVNREYKKATIVSYVNGADPWGQQAQHQMSKPIEITLCLYEHRPEEGPRFNEVEWFGLSKSKDIEEGQVIEIGSKRYSVLFVNPTTKLTQVFMRCD